MGLARLGRCPSQFELASRAEGPVQADRTNIFFCRQINVHRCREIRSSSNSKVRRCENFSVIF